MKDLYDDPVWICKDGRKIAIPKLEEEHLVNIVSMWRRNVDAYRRHVERLGNLDYLPHYEDVHEDQQVELLGGEVGMLLELEDDDFLRATFSIFNDLLWECIHRGLMDGDTGEWLRPPGLGDVDAEKQMEFARRIIECGVHV